MRGQALGLILGKVEDVEDPAKQGRVRVSFPSHGEGLSQWAPIARPLASGGFGLFFQPEPGDMVLIGLEDGRIERPYVLGAIYTGDNAPPDDDNAKRVIQSQSGHRIMLDDTGGSETLSLTDASGNSIVMNQDGITIEAANNVVIKGVEVTIEADAQLTGKGSPIHLNP